MVKEIRIVFEPSDIVSLRIVCVNCDGEIVYPLTAAFKPAIQCPHCRSYLREPDAPDAFDHLRQWIQLSQTKESWYRVKLEIRDESPLPETLQE